jgi:heme exporter protein D
VQHQKFASFHHRKLSLKTIHHMVAGIFLGLLSILALVRIAICHDVKKRKQILQEQHVIAETKKLEKRYKQPKKVYINMSIGIKPLTEQKQLKWTCPKFLRNYYWSIGTFLPTIILSLRQK